MQNNKLPPAPFFNPRKRLRKAVVADPSTDLESQGWVSSFGNIPNPNDGSMMHHGNGPSSYPQHQNRSPTPINQRPASSSYPNKNYSATFTSGQHQHQQQQGLTNQKILSRGPNQSSTSSSTSSRPGPIKKEFSSGSTHQRTNPYSRSNLQDNAANLPRSDGAKTTMTNQRTFSASNIHPAHTVMTAPKMTVTSGQTHPMKKPVIDHRRPGRNQGQNSWNDSNRPKPQAPQPYQPLPCRQLLGGEGTSYPMPNIMEADPAPGFANSPSDLDLMDQKKYRSAPSKGVSQPKGVKKTTLEDTISPVFSTTIQQLKLLYSKYKNKLNMIFEIFGVLDSATHPNVERTGKQFILRDETDRIECVFYEIDRVLPRLTRGHWQRCIGLADKQDGRLMCLSVRPANSEERRAVQELAPLLEQHLNTMDSTFKC